MKTKLYLGLDVHKNSIVVATALADGSEAQIYGKWGGSNLSAERGLRKVLKKFGVDKNEISIVYEAGPTGFVLARRLLQLGYHCIIVGPSEVPEKSGKRVKTDRIDASKLARLHRAGELDAIHIPEARDEAVRDLCRARTDAMQALARAKQQLGMFMLRNGNRYDGKTTWTQAHMNYLRRTRMQHPAQQLVLEEYILEVDSGTERVARIETHMKDLLPDWERESSSGEKRRQGGITKTGNGHARWMMIECASHYSHAPRVSPQLSARQAGQSREVRSIAWRAQNRLNHRFRRLAARQLHRNKVVVAVARELCGFIWELHLQVETEVRLKTMT
jgi:transposase